MAQDRQVIESGQPVVIPEEEFTDGRGRKRVLRTVKIPLIFPDREAPAVLGVSTDITEMKQAANELRQAYRQAYELDAERQHVQILTQFIQDSSHEFRTPLSVIGTSLYLMTRTTDDAKRAMHAEQANAQIARITRLLDHLQTMADLDSGVPFELAPLSINVLIRDVVSHMEKAAQKRNLTIHMMLEGRLPPVTADTLRLRQAFEHVLDNALRFTPHDGSVSITTMSKPGAVVVEVRDTGVGIPQEMLPNVMRRFWRRDQAHTTPGFGLGLPIVQKIIDRHQGTLTLHSLDNTGTTVTITLPTL
jgi:signal transduction histidine kinase